MKNKLLSFVWGWCLIIVCVVFSIKITAVNAKFYIPRYEEMNLAEEIQVSKSDLEKSIIMLMDYLNDERDDLNDTITWRGNEQATFNESEIAHMVDVKALYQNAIKVAYIAFGILMIITLYLGIAQKKLMFAFLAKGMLRAMITFLVCIIFFGFWVLTDFTSFWTWFHTIFFSNQLWLMDPATDFMINMLPETIFSQLVISCASKVIIVLVIVSGASIIYLYKKAPIGFETKEHKI